MNVNKVPAESLQRQFEEKERRIKNIHIIVSTVKQHGLFCW